MKYRNYHARRRRENPLLDIIQSLNRQLHTGPGRQVRSCRCDDCRLARAHDVTPEGQRRPELAISTEDLAAIAELAAARQWNTAELEGFTFSLFGKVPALLTLREAAAVIAHLRRDPK